MFPIERVAPVYEFKAVEKQNGSVFHARRQQVAYNMLHGKWQRIREQKAAEEN
ncbi:hypothetical protein J8273_3128 [Carpediemonas membranifera]|uniref:Uncharacterized protein n=1 Tax=Carpediemonas membranifera TaxID=201153 RepID=A0A8J6AV47_9EUKA|nr:hypothetical protein J8273_3128 [Carpediemonas membranifera]|eukprot:KAG9395551.1 hypothetical protein J8273_3128 [Carpediemonas membranifera]